MTKKILVIDDSELVLSVVRSHLSSAGFEVVTRTMAVGTRAAVLREQPDVVLLDVNMPLLDGGEVCAAIRAHSGIGSTCIYLHSDRPEAELRKLAAECGADGVLCKTGDRAGFLREFQALLAQSAPTSEPTAEAPGSYVLVACGPAVQRRLRSEWVSGRRVEYTESGTEALRRVFSSNAPELLLLGSSLPDMRWQVVHEQVTSLDASYGARTVLIREGREPLPPRYAQWDPSGSLEDLDATLHRLRATL